MRFSIKVGGGQKGGNARFFNCLEYKVRIAILYLLNKLELIEILIISLSFPD